MLPREPCASKYKKCRYNPYYLIISNLKVMMIVRLCTLLGMLFSVTVCASCGWEIIKRTRGRAILPKRRCRICIWRETKHVSTTSLPIVNTQQAKNLVVTERWRRCQMLQLARRCYNSRGVATCSNTFLHLLLLKKTILVLNTICPLVISSMVVLKLKKS